MSFNFLTKMIVLKEEINLSDFTVIIPSIAVGNVAQLTVDLVISSMKLKRIGSGWHPALMPIFGPPAYHHDKENKTMCFEVYGDINKKLLVFQIRSPLVAQFIKDFHEKLVKFLVDCKVRGLIILTSSHAYEKHSVESTPFEYLCNEQYKTHHNDKIAQMKWKEFNGGTIHGGGNAKNLLQVCTLEQLPSLILFKYVSEGDNSPDAGHLVGELNQFCDLFPSCKDKGHSYKLTVPVSWKLLFGNEPPELIF